MPVSSTRKRRKEPAFKKIRSDLIAKVTSGKLLPGHRLQDERTLSREYRVSRDTIRRALKLLSEEKIIDRIHGDGTYVRNPVTSIHQKIAVIFFGREVPGDEYVFSTLGLMGRRIEAARADMVFRSYVTSADLEAGLTALNGEPDLLGGIILSPNTFEEIEWIRDRVRFPLVLLGDMAFPNRTRPVINQIVGSNYLWGHTGARELMARKCGRLAMVMIDRYFVWTAEAVRGFCDASRSLADSMKKVFAFQRDENIDIGPPDPLALMAWAEELVGDWVRTGWMPDGLFMQTPWLMRVVVQAFLKAGVPSSNIPFLAVRGDPGISFRLDRPDLKVIVIRLQHEPLIDRAIRRLQEIKAGDNTTKIEVLLQEVQVEYLGGKAK